jgi:tRNA modification GTPase
LTDSEAAITSPIAGTTRDVITRAVAMEGVPFVFFDTAGLGDATDPIEAIGITRAEDAIDDADLVLWLGEEEDGPLEMPLWEIAARCDLVAVEPKQNPHYVVSARTGAGIDDLRRGLVERARAEMPRPGEAAVSERQWRHLVRCARALEEAAEENDPLLVAEGLRLARLELDRLVGRSGTEDMLDALFGRFCIGK